MTEAESLDDIGQLYDWFYDPRRKSIGRPEPSQIVFCPVIETDGRLRIGEVARSDSHTHTQVSMHIRDQEKNDFRGKENRLPIKGLKLDATHELIISRAKLRPCLVIGGCQGIDRGTIPDGVQRKYASSFHPVYLLAPVYHVSHGDEIGAFGPIVTARIKCLMYPEFFYLRQSGGYLRVPSVARLDRMFLQAPHPGLGFELTDLFVHSDIFSLVLGQVKYLLGQEMSAEQREVRDLMLSTLPASAMPPL